MPTTNLSGIALSRRKLHCVETGLSVTVRALSLPDADALAALRAWHEGLSSREAMSRTLLNG